MPERIADTPGPFLFKVRPLHDDPRCTEKRFRRFVGKIEHDIGIQSVVGMSGGPIDGFASTRVNRYWVVAIQASWLKQERVVFGTPIPVLAEFVLELFMPKSQGSAHNPIP